MLSKDLKLLIIDTETSGLDLATNKVIELGAILYSVEHQTSLHQISTLLQAPNNPVEPINRIPPQALPGVSNSLQAKSLEIFWEMAQEASYAVAHNTEFDSQWFNDHHLPKLNNSKGFLRWLCTMDDFKWPLQTKPRESLVNLALHHGIGVSTAHRALSDCLLIAALFDRMENLTEMITYALRPKKQFKAVVSYEDRQLAKDAGFKWEADKKIWSRKMADEDTLELPFTVSCICPEEAVLPF